MSMRVYYDDTVVYNNVQHDGDNPTVEETNVDEPQSEAGATTQDPLYENNDYTPPETTDRPSPTDAKSHVRKQGKLNTFLKAAVLFTLLVIIVFTILSWRSIMLLASHHLSIEDQTWNDSYICHVHGEVNGLLLQMAGRGAYNDCLQMCKANWECTWFAFVKPKALCLLYAAGKLSSEIYRDGILVGQKECIPAHSMCSEKGRCLGHTWGVKPAADENVCQYYCHEEAQCNYYTFMANTSTCLLMGQCIRLEEQCGDDCRSGQKECFGQSFLLREKKLFVVGGYHPSTSTFVEVIDVHRTNSVFSRCSYIPNFPVPLRGGAGGVLNGTVVVCGGYKYNADCYRLEWEEGRQAWVKEEHGLLYDVFLPAHIQLSPNELWITGGETRRTQIKRLGQNTTLYKDLPILRTLHNVVKVNDSHFFLAGSNNSTVQAWMFDIVNQVWSVLPDIPEPNSDFAAGLVHYPDGNTEVVVVGGEKVNYCYSLNIKSLRWKPCPKLPLMIQDAASVQLEDTFMVIGGKANDTEFTHDLDTIFLLDVLSRQWLLMPQSLMYGRRLFCAFLVPASVLPCDLP